MNSFRLTSAAVLFVVLTLSGKNISRAQEKSDTPTPPYVADVPDFCQWTLTVTPNEVEPNQDNPPVAPAVDQRGKTVPAPVTVVKVICTRTKEIKRDIIYYSNNNSSEVWYVGQHVVVRSANREITVLSVGSQSAALIVSDLSAKGFVGVDWITPETFRGNNTLPGGILVNDYRGVSVIANPGKAFASSIPGSDSEGKPLTPVALQDIKIPTEAMIAINSRLPFVVIRGDKKITYSFQASPTEMLQIPADIQKRMISIQNRDNYVNQIRALQQH